MARHAGVDWTIPDKPQSWEQVNTAVLMDLRDELKRLNALLSCPNFTRIPATLRTIQRNTARRKKKPTP